MTENTASTKSRGCLFYLGLVIGLGILLYLFREELIALWQILQALPALLRGEPTQVLAPGNKILPALAFLGANLIGAIVFGFMLIILLSQVVLPVPTGSGRFQLANRITAYMGGFRPRVLFVREGKLTKPIEDAGQIRGGVVIVDLNSAIVLERQLRPIALEADVAKRDATQPPRFPGRVGKPGVVFVGLNERLRGAVSLRKQFRISEPVRAYTRDGIEVECRVFAIFSLGQSPTVKKVGYIGDMVPENLYVIQIDEETKKIKEITNDLDEADRIEIHRYAQGFLTSNEMPASLEPTDKGEEYPPFALEEERILNAVYAQARKVGEIEMDAWGDLPAQVATEVFRNQISQIAYDDIYLPKNPTRFPLMQEIKPRFARTVKSLGVMSYQFMHRLDGQSIEKGQRVDFRQFRISAVQPFRTSRILRDRGLKVIHSSFTELVPIDPAVRLQRMESWRAPWQKEIEIARAEQDRAVEQILDKSRADKQREMIDYFSNILRSPKYSEEALVRRMFQALDDIINDPAARRNLPHEIISLLRNLRIWLLPDNKLLPDSMVENSSIDGDEVEDER